MENLATTFMTLFAGLDRAHGRYEVKGNGRAGEKQTGQASTIREPVTEELWESHLMGDTGIGIIPITDDATCRWGAIDIDNYELTLEDLAAEVARLRLPLVVCRSKSGGPHLYLFCKEFVKAELIRGKLMEFAVALGYAGVEVFPKQTRLAGANDIGNWINMPYFGGDDTNRYAINYQGDQLDVSGFLALAATMAVSEEELKAIEIEVSKEHKDFWEDAPPCLQCLAARGFGEGGRNKALFNIGVYLRKRHGDTWTEHLDAYNQQYMDPPLGHKEVAYIAKSVNRKAYEYTCNDTPIVTVCNKQICLTRKHGIGTSEADPGVVFGNLVKVETDPPIWIWDVDGARLELTTQELKEQSRFASKCLEMINKWPNPVKPRQWADLVREKLTNVEIIPAPTDATPEGRMLVLLEQYCTARATAKTKDELLLNRPWTSEGRTFFSSVHFHQFLQQNRMNVSERQLWAWLRKRGAEHHFFHIKNKGYSCWSIEAFPEQVMDFDVPRLDGATDDAPTM
jgi:hypothetical protein